MIYATKRGATADIAEKIDLVLQQAGLPADVIAPERPLLMPFFALDGGEEPELVGLYVVGDKGDVLRVGFALGNEFSDHVMEKQTDRWIAVCTKRAEKGAAADLSLHS